MQISALIIGFILLGAALVLSADLSGKNRKKGLRVLLSM